MSPLAQRARPPRAVSSTSVRVYESMAYCGKVQHPQRPPRWLWRWTTQFADTTNAAGRRRQGRLGLHRGAARGLWCHCITTTDANIQHSRTREKSAHYIASSWYRSIWRKTSSTELGFPAFLHSHGICTSLGCADLHFPSPSQMRNWLLARNASRSVGEASE